MELVVIKSCPFCGHQPALDLEDYCYPSIIDKKTYKIRLWRMGCNESAGGCTAEVLGSTEEEAINHWNRRV